MNIDAKINSILNHRLDLRKTCVHEGVTLTPLGHGQILYYHNKTKTAGYAENKHTCNKCQFEYTMKPKSCINTTKEIVDKKTKNKTCRNKSFTTQLIIDNEKFDQIVINNPIIDMGKVHYFVPEEKELKQFISGKQFRIEEDQWGDLFQEVVNSLRVGLDLRNEENYYMLALWIIQTYFTDFLDNTLSVAIKGQSGSAKTIILEYLQSLGYRTKIADTTIAAMYLLVNDYGFNLLFDEIDETNENKKGELMSIIRSSYRRGQSKIRASKINGNYSGVEAFNIFSTTGMSYRRKVPDDIQNRSITIESIKSHDNRLPLVASKLNYINYILRCKLFFAYVIKYWSSLQRFSSLITLITQITYQNVQGKKNLSDLGINKERQKIYDFSTESYPPKVKEYMETLQGRNIELFNLCYRLSKVTDLDLFDVLQSVFDNKKEQDIIHQDEYLDVMRRFLRKLITEIKAGIDYESKEYHIQRGDKKGFIKFPVTKIRQEFNQHLSNSSLQKISDSRYKKLLTDLGFYQDKKTGNLYVNQLINGKTTRCAIFDKKILKEIDYE